VSAFLSGLVLGQLIGNGTAADATTLSISDRTETRVRSSLVGTGPNIGQGTTAIDIDNAIQATIAGSRRRLSWVVGYSPRFSYSDIEGDRALSLMHAGHISGSYWTRRLRLTLSLDGSAGSQSAIAALTPVNFDVAAPRPAPSITAPPGTAVAPTAPQIPTPIAGPTYIPLTSLVVLNTGSARASLAAAYAFSHRITGTGSASYGFTGGFDYYSQLVSPPSRGPGVDVSVAYAITHRDQLASSANASYITVLATPRPGVLTGPDRSYLITGLVESYRHAWSKFTSSSIGVGLTYLAAPDTVAGQYVGGGNGLSAAGDVNIVHVEPLGRATRLEYRAAVQLGVVFNQALGAAQQQLSSTVSWSWTHDKVSVGLAGGAATTLPFDAYDAGRTISGTASVAYSPAKAVQLQTGLRAYAQLFPPTAPAFVGAAAPVNTPPQWIAFAAVTVFVPVLGF
jgi:hypothetical protein